MKIAPGKCNVGAKAQGQICADDQLSNFTVFFLSKRSDSKSPNYGILNFPDTKQFFQLPIFKFIFVQMNTQIHLIAASIDSTCVFKFPSLPNKLLGLFAIFFNKLMKRCASHLRFSLASILTLVFVSAIVSFSLVFHVLFCFVTLITTGDSIFSRSSHTLPPLEKVPTPRCVFFCPPVVFSVLSPWTEYL